MEYEFDPTLTQQAQNRYAEGMSGPGAPEQNPNTIPSPEEAGNETPVSQDQEAQTPEQAAREAQQQAAQREAAERVSAKQARDESLLGIERMEKNGRIDPQIAEFLRKQLMQRDPYTALEYYNQLQNRLSSDNPQQVYDAFNTFSNMAKQLVDDAEDTGGEIFPEIEMLANVNPLELTDNQKKQLVDAANAGGRLTSAYLERSFTGGRERGSPLDEYYPPSLEDVGRRAMELESPEWKPGGEYQILDNEGNFQPNNFLRWLRKKWLTWGHQFSPDNPQVQPWGVIQIPTGISSIGLEQLIGTDRFWQKKQIDPLTGREVFTFNQGYDDLRYALINEFFMFGKAHEFDATYRSKMANEKELLSGVLPGLYGQNIWTQYEDRLMLTWRISATSGDIDKEYAWMGKAEEGTLKQEGRVGRAHRLADLLYWRISHLEKWDDYDPRTGKKLGGFLDRVKTAADYYSDNRFYEALGSEGVRAFYMSMVKRGLDAQFNGVGGLATDFLGELKAAGIKGITMETIMFDPQKIRTMLADPEAAGKIANLLRTQRGEAAITGLDSTVGEYRNLQKSLQIAKALPDFNFDVFVADALRKMKKRGVSAERVADIEAKIKQARQSVTEQAVRSKVGELTQLAAGTGPGSLREKILSELTKKVGFRDSDRVKKLFDAVMTNTSYTYDAKGKSRTLIPEMALEELGLRFADAAMYNNKLGGKWETDPEDAWKQMRTKQVNLFNSKEKSKELQGVMRKAVRDAIGKLNNLDDFDAEYAENFSYSKVYFTGTAAYNDTTATGFDAWTKILRFRDYRKKQLIGAGNAFGDLQNLAGIKRLSLTFWEGMFGSKVDATGKRTNMSLLKFMETGFTPEDRQKAAMSEGKAAQLPDFDFQKMREDTFGSNHINNGFGLYSKILSEHSIPFEKMIKIDFFKRVQVDRGEIDKMMNGWYKDIRYTFNQMGFDFEQVEDDVDIVWVKNADGVEKAEARFGKKKLKDILFEREIVNMGMYERRFFREFWKNGRIGERDIDGEDMLTQYSRNVFAWLIAKEILEHRMYDSKNSLYNLGIWNLDMVHALEELFLQYPIGDVEQESIDLFNRNKKFRKVDSFFTKKEFKKIRKMGNAGYDKLWGENIRGQMAETFWYGNKSMTKKFFAYIFSDMWSFK